ncbi:MAG: hypothetical protein J6B96_00115 [Agathobacter sp.]|nr:hypothetical protein [Agathobacter sp.]
MKLKKLVSLLLAGVMVVSCLTACTPTAQPPVSENPGSEKPGSEAPEVEWKLAESPVLAALVTDGKLPAVADRVPKTEDIFISKVDAKGDRLSIGNYGGDLNVISGGGSWDLSRPVLESIIRYNTDGSYVPNVIKSFEHNDTYTEWTFHLREGMKWSDGNDFNADDITFWYYMCHLNNFDTKKSWTALKDGDDAWATLEKVDEYTVKWKFNNPKLAADFIENGDFKWCWAPSHYLIDMIPAKNHVENPYWESTGLSDEQVLINAKAKGIDKSTVKDLGKAVSYYFWNEDGIPTVNSYVLKAGNSKDDQVCTLERNPYYWKTDAAGNQLPYIDNIVFNKTSADGQDQLLFRSGKIDIIGIAMQDIATTLEDMGTAAELRTFASSNWGSYQITFNYTNKDPKYAELFNNIKFREAMSIAVDRAQVSQVLADGFLDPGQCCPAEGNFGYDADWDKKWTTYDVARAKTLLEECGLVMGDDGFYNFADGTDLLIPFYMYVEAGNAGAYPVFEQYWEAIGIDCASKEYEVAAFDGEIDNNDWYAILGPHTSIGGLSLRDRVAPFVPIQQAAEWYGEFGTWYGTNGASGVEPTGDMAKLLEIYEKWNTTPDSAKRDEYTLEIYKIHKDNLWSIAYLQAAGSYNLISAKIKNYPDNLVSADLYQYANIVHYETLYKVQ